MFDLRSQVSIEKLSSRKQTIKGKDTYLFLALSVERMVTVWQMMCGVTCGQNPEEIPSWARVDYGGLQEEHSQLSADGGEEI